MNSRSASILLFIAIFASTTLLMEPGVRAATVQLTITLNPSSGSNPITTGNWFNVSYTVGGVKKWTPQNTTQLGPFPVDASSNVTIKGTTSASTSTEKWCFKSACTAISFITGTSTTLKTYYYYDLLLETVSDSTFGGGSVTVSLTYRTAPSLEGNMDVPALTSIPLTSIAKTIMALRASTASVPQQVLGVSGERWATATASWVISSPNQLPSPIAYYHQYTATASYSIYGGGSPSPATFTSHQYGALLSQPLTSSPQAIWVDNGASWGLSNPLLGSSSTERWQTNSATSGTVTSSFSLTRTYFHQFLLTLSYLVTGGGTPTAPLFASTSFGAPTSTTPTSSPQGIWLDSGASWSITNPLASSGSTERWQTPDADSGTVASSFTLAPTYYHQESVPANYQLQGGGTPSGPTLASMAFGSTVTQLLTTTPQNLWLDDGAPWNLTNPLPGSSSIERWFTNTAAGTVAAGGFIVPTFTLQYWIAYTVAPQEGGSTDPAAAGWYDASSTITIQAIPNPGYNFTNWVTSGSISLDDPTSSFTTAQINGAGTISADFIGSPPTSTAITPRMILPPILILSSMLILRRGRRKQS